jgi:predicted AAA+ superfamily ATPase
MILKRYVTDQIRADLNKGKIIILYGARQVGKTTVVKDILASIPQSMYYNCDQSATAELFAEHNLARLSSLVAAYDTIAIDEAQRVPGIGLSLKILIDAFPSKNFLVTGSSSFDLAERIVEPLTGRHFTHVLFPISFGEIVATTSSITLRESLEERMLFGSYPEVIVENDMHEKRRRIEHIASDYLFADVLTLSVVRDVGILRRLLQAVALQLGSEVSSSELANLLDIDRKTVIRYLDVCEKMFILFSLPSSRGNVRNAIAKQKKYYFYDLGIRNALINNFNTLTLRTDTGALWENLMVVERMKRNETQRTRPQYSFWRSYQGHEIDLIEEIDGVRDAYEMKYTDSTPSKKAQRVFMEEMHGNSLSVINRTTFEPFLLS